MRGVLVNGAGEKDVFSICVCRGAIGIRWAGTITAEAKTCRRDEGVQLDSGKRRVAEESVVSAGGVVSGSCGKNMPRPPRGRGGQGITGAQLVVSWSAHTTVTEAGKRSKRVSARSSCSTSGSLLL